LHLALAASLFFFTSAFAQFADQVFVGPRPLSMGEAFVAVADDGNALFWNPAGLARLERIEASFANANLYNLGIQSYYAGLYSRPYFIPMLTDHLTLGAGWSVIKLGEDDGLAARRDQFSLSFGIRPPRLMRALPGLNLGVNAKYWQLTSTYDKQPEADLKGLGLDAGVLFELKTLLAAIARKKEFKQREESERQEKPGPEKPAEGKKKKLRGLDGLALGVMIHDVRGTRARHQKTKRWETVQRQHTRWGLSYRPFDELRLGYLHMTDPVLAFDWDDRLHLGAELRLWGGLALRAGLQRDRLTDEKGLAASFGIGFNLKQARALQADYAYTDLPGLPTTSHYNFSLINEDPRSIRIEEKHFNDVFASLYPHYALPNSELGTVKLKNVSDENLKVRVSFKTDRYMKRAPAIDLEIEPERSADVPLRAVFDSTIIAASFGRLTGTLKVEYGRDRPDGHSTQEEIDLALHGKNYLTWDNPEKAAAFVTYDDPLVAKFVEAARRVKHDSTKAGWFTRYNLVQALKLYYALQAYGISYNKDPETPFPSLAGKKFRLDKITYPATLLRREKTSGDCDDLTVLYASLLQHASLPAAFVSLPGHIFLMFDTGLPAAEIHTLPLDPKLFWIRNGNLWIPIETTLIPTSNFIAAWDTAAARLHQNASDTTWKICEIAAAQATYPPLALHSESYEPSLADFSPAMNRELFALEELKASYLKDLEQIEQKDLPAIDKLAQEQILEEERTRNRYGVLLAQSNEEARAQALFKKLREWDATFAPAWNNEGNVAFMLGDFASARKLYGAALQANPNGRGTYLNLALLHQMMKGEAPQDSSFHQQQSDEMLTKAAELLEDDLEAAYVLVGIPRGSTDQELKHGLIDAIRARMVRWKNVIDNAFKQHIQKKEIRGLALDRYGSKNQGQIDRERGTLLHWSY
jgi:hypothetical protein